MANAQLQQTYVRLQREIADHDRQIKELTEMRASKAEALEQLKAHAPTRPGEAKSEAPKAPTPTPPAEAKPPETPKK